MAAAATNSSTFPLFTSLPRELRDQIWRDALPDKVEPAFSFYKEGCWCFRRLSESDEGYDIENNENNLNFEFRHDLLDDIRFEIPLVYVNREARDLAFAWIREQGIEIRPRRNTPYPVFVRPFNPMRDALYVALNKWDALLCEPDGGLLRPDLFGQFKSDLTHIAVPLALLRSEATSLPQMFLHHFNLKVLLIIVDPQPDLQSANIDVKVQHRWDLKSTQGGAFFWNDDRGGFDSANGEYVSDKALSHRLAGSSFQGLSPTCRGNEDPRRQRMGYRLIDEAIRGLGEGLANDHIRGFEIRPVVAVRR